MAGLLRPSVESLRALGNWSQTFRWNVDFVTTPRCLTGGGDEPESGRAWASLLPEDINFRAESMSIPEKEIETTEIQIRGSKVRQEGVGNYNSPITLTLVETIDPVALDFLSDWQEAAWRTRDGSLGTTRYKSNIECEMRLQLLDSEDLAYYEYILIGCQPATGTVGDVDAGTGDPLKPAIGIFFDYFTRSSLRRSRRGHPNSNSLFIDQPHT